MGLEELKNDIIENNKKEMEKIRRDADIKIKEIEGALKAKIEEKKKAGKLKIKSELQQIEQIKTLEAKSKANQRILDKKRELIELTIREAKEALRKNNEVYLKRLLEKTQSQINVERVYCGEEDTKFLKIKTTPKDLGGGIIAENKEGTVSVDYSYDSLLDQIKERHLFDIARLLFE